MWRVDDLQRRLAAALEDRDDVRVAVLFGSHARDRAREDSDVDLAVLGPVDLLELAGSLAGVLGREVDVVPLDTPNVPLLAAIVRDGQLVLERDAGAYAAWRSRAVASLEIDLPNWIRMRDAWLRRVAERGL